jgi:uncharacterized protein
MMLVPVRVGSSAIESLGVFAVEAIARGSAVWELTHGFDVVVPRELWPAWKDARGAFLARYGYLDERRGAYILCCDDARFMNHAADPNVGEVTDDRCLALRDIAPGEELTCDYRRLDPRRMLFAPSEAEVLLRPAVREDRSRALALFAEHLASLGYAPDRELDADMETFPAAYESRPDRFLVAIDRGEMVAIGGIRAGELRRIYVRASHRRRGIARRLIARLVEGAPKDHLFAVIARDNQPAMRTFASCGFVPTGRAPDHPKMKGCEIWERRC